jgi:hypothetical protein
LLADTCGRRQRREQRHFFYLEHARLVDRIWIGACPNGDGQFPSYDILFADDTQNWHRISANDLIRSPERLEAKLPFPIIVRSIRLRLTSPLATIEQDETDHRIGFVMTN